MKAFNVPFEEVKVHVSGKGVHGGLLKDYSPSGLVPCLKDGEDVIWDSLAIAEYLAESYPGMWPADKKARAHCRCVSAEMHSGFGDLRSAMPMNIKKRLAGREVKSEVETNIFRIVQIWSDCRRHFGHGGPWLFGSHFTIADAMYAPIAWRFFTYNYLPSDPVAREYVATLLEHPAMVEWESAALVEESAAGDVGAIPHYDAAAFSLGGEDRGPGDNTRQGFIDRLRQKTV